MYDEIFQWDQKLHVIDFMQPKKEGSEYSEIKKLVAHTGGTYKNVNSFGDVRFRS